MRRVVHSTIALLCLTVSAAWAQEGDPEAALLEAAANEGGGLEEKKAPPKKVLDDPDPKALEALEKQRAELEGWVNTFQEKAQKFEKVDAAFNKVMGDMLTANDAFDSSHHAQVEAYRAAVAEDRVADKKKTAKAVAKMRVKYVKTLTRLQKRAAKVEKLFDKIAAKAAKEEAEDAAEAAGDQ